MWDLFGVLTVKRSNSGLEWRVWELGPSGGILSILLILSVFNFLVFSKVHHKMWKLVSTFWHARKMLPSFVPFGPFNLSREHYCCINHILRYFFVLSFRNISAIIIIVIFLLLGINFKREG